MMFFAKMDILNIFQRISHEKYYLVDAKTKKRDGQNPASPI